MSLDDDSWIDDLEEALESDPDLTSLQKLCHQHLIPDRVRSSLWQACLEVRGKKVMLEEFFDLNEQSFIRNDCMSLVKNLDNEEAEQLSVAGDIESVITTLSKSLDVAYTSDSGWIEVIETLMNLKMTKEETYACLEVIVKKYIPRATSEDQAYHLLRLLILYHDPELCSFLDSKKVHPEQYTGSWFRSLFASQCTFEVTQAIWDTYFVIGDPFHIFFVALVILINSRDQILEMSACERDVIVSTIVSIPKALQLEDVGDLFTLVETHYRLHTPTLSYLHHLIFQPIERDSYDTDLAHALCLPVQAKDLLQDKSVKYFVIDCRSPEEYNAGRLHTAFHLDASLMLQDRSAFEIAVDALLTVQRQAIDANSVAGGDHICFMGSGRNDEDSYVFMVVASFLQKNYKYVSLCTGGYQSLHDLVRRKRQENLLVDHEPFQCRLCRLDASTSRVSNGSRGGSGSSVRENEGFNTSIFDKLSTAVKCKTNEVRGKLVELVTANPGSRDRFKGLSGLFEDNNDDADDVADEVEPEVNVDSWAKEHSAIAVFMCRELREDHCMFDSFLLLTATYIYILREARSKKGWGKIVAKRPLEMIVQITSKRKVPELITFKYGETNENSDSGPNIIATDCLIFQKPYEVTRLVKQQVIKVLDGVATDPTERS